MILEDYKLKIARAEGRKTLLMNQFSDKQFVMNNNKESLIALEKAQAFIQTVAQKTQEQLKFHIENVVNLGLNALFPDEYTFSLEFVVKYKKTEASFVFKKNGHQIEVGPYGATGGGVVDMASLALRIAAWSLGKTDNVLILDEPIQKIQPPALQEIAWQVIKELSKRLSLQFIIISNSSNNVEFVQDIADRTFVVVKENEEIDGATYGVSTVKEN